MSSPVWTYWEGPRPEWIEACLNSMRRYCGNRLTVVTPETVPHYIPEDKLHPNWNRVPSRACKASAVRSALLEEYGGWWFDADTVMVKAPPLLMPSTFTYTTWRTNRALSGYFGTPPHGRVIRWWHKAVNRILHHRFSEVRAWWLILGDICITAAVALYGGRQIPRATWLPIDFNSNPDTFLQPGDPEDFATDGTMCFGLNHSWLVEHAAKELGVSVEEQAQSPLLLHRLLTMARSHPRRVSEVGYNSPPELQDRLLSTLEPGMRTLECGSGVTTDFFEKLGCHHTALEHNVEYAGRHLYDHDSLILCPLAGDPPWYDWQPAGPYDVVLIDGPGGPESGGPGNHGVLRVFAELVHDESIVMVDKSDYPYNRELVKALSDTWPSRIQHVQCVYGGQFSILRPRHSGEEDGREKADG